MKNNKAIKKFGKKFKRQKNRFIRKRILTSKKNNKKIYHLKFKNTKYIKKIMIILFLLFVYIIIYYFFDNDKIKNYGLSFAQKMDDYNTKNFAIFIRNDCPMCGFFSHFIVLLGCANKYLKEGYIPIIDLVSFRNKYNNGNKLIHNPWELFFYQMNNYTLEEVKNYAKNYTYKYCDKNNYRPNEKYVYYQNDSIIFWHNFIKKYSPFKKELMIEAKIIMKKLFGRSKNILGVKIRGTDYYRRPINHAIPAKVEKIIPDVKEFDKKYKYDYIYLATEDNTVKKKFMPEFVNKVKFLEPENKKFNNRIEQNLDDLKNYIFTIIILSKCLDLIACRCSGTAAVYVLTEGFRHAKVYNLGSYK